MGKRSHITLACLSIGIAVFTRIIARAYFKNAPSQHVEMPTESDFAVAKPGKDIFFYDLGGTLCVCDKKWDVDEYWSKVISGFAFNFAHVIGTFEFYVLTGNAKLLIIGVFVNEMIEELWLTTGYWGFTLDPPMDMEARYDSLIRDTVCCFLGISLASKFGKIFKIRPTIKWPMVIKWDMTNPHSSARWAKFAVQGLALWQITLIYNADLGPHHFNPANIFLLVMYAASIGVICWWNMDDHPTLTKRHIISWHVGWAAFSIYLFLYTINPSFDSAMYLIFVVESTATIALYALDIAIRYNYQNIKVTIFGYPDMKSRSNGNLLDEDAAHSVSIDSFRAALDKIDESGHETVSITQLKLLASDITSEKEKGVTIPTAGEWVTLGFKCFVRIVIVIVCMHQPFLWHGIQYKRHWCGNPLVQGFNGCKHTEL